MPTPPPLLAEIVERSLEPYKKLFSSETISWMREEAMAQLTAHPYSAALLDALSAAPQVQSSDSLPKAGSPAEPAARAGKGAA